MVPILKLDPHLMPQDADNNVSSQDEGEEAEVSGPVQLASVSEKHLSAKCRPDTLTYCPTMDLVALATEDEQVHAFRLNGQKVFGGLARGGDGLSVKALRWKGNGEII